jgi:hypothetical protein
LFNSVSSATLKYRFICPVMALRRLLRKDKSGKHYKTTVRQSDRRHSVSKYRVNMHARRLRYVLIKRISTTGNTFLVCMNSHIFGETVVTKMVSATGNPFCGHMKK